jgi:putative ABC transport system permease protein
MRAFEWLPWIRARRSEELADELRAHLEMAAEDRVDRGESPDVAAASARREFGNVGLVHEVAQDQWLGIGTWIDHLYQDVRFAVRMLGRARRFTVVAALTMALGVGATTAIFSVVDATLLRPLPYPHPEQLVRIVDDLDGIGAQDIGMSTPEWRDLQHSGVFTYISPTWYDDNNLTGLAHPQRVGILSVATNYFALLGVKPQLGVAFDPTDATPGFNGQAVISDGEWKRAFGGDSSVIGRLVQLDSDSYRIIGVMPPGFVAPGGTRQERSTEVWPAFGFSGEPLNEATVQSRASLFPGAIGRLAPGLSLADAQQRIDVLVQSLRRQYPADYPAERDWRVRLVPLKDHVVGDTRQPLLFLLAAVGLVLLIGCANVANLLLARATTRGREMAVRQALGGSAARLIRQLLTESIVLAVVGGGVGLYILVVARSALARMLPDNLPRLDHLSIDWGVLLFAFFASLAAGAIFGLAPALGVRRLNVTGVLKQEGRASTASGEQKRMRHLLVAAEFALSLVLLSAAGLLTRSFWDLLNAPLGFDPRNVTVVHTRLPYPNDPREDLYPTAGSIASFVREAMRRSRALPGVDEVAFGIGGVPLENAQQDKQDLRALFEGVQDPKQATLITSSLVTPSYFRVLGLKLLRGRLFDEFDTDDHPSVAVINDAMARAYWPNDNPLGKRFRLLPQLDRWTTVIGIVADARTESLASPAQPHLYVSLYQRRGKHLAIFVRGTAQPTDIERGVREKVQTLNSALPVFGAERLADIVSASLAIRRFTLRLIALFATTALALAAIGIYGVIAYMVSERTQEIGVRLALGARSTDVLRLVMRQGVRPVITGAIVGLLGALAVARAMSGLLVGVNPADPLTFALSTLVLVAFAIAGCYVPARRALRVDPIVALRS